MLILSEFEPYFEYLRREGLKEKTIREHRRVADRIVKPAVGHLHFENITLIDLGAIKELGRQSGKYGHQRGLVVFRSLMRYVKLKGVRMNFDVSEVKVPRLPKSLPEYLTPEEFDSLRNCFDCNNEASLRMRTLIEVLIDTGMRISEICSLNKTDFDFENHKVFVVNCKNNKKNFLHLTDRSILWLKRYWETRKDNMECAFVSGRGRLLPVTSRNYLRTHAKHLGIHKHIRHHIMRSTYVTFLLHGGVDIKTTQILARHESPTTTLNYYAGVCEERAGILHQKVFNSI